MSCPAIGAKGPSRRKPVRRAIMRRGFAANNSVASRPIDSSTPGRKGSMRISACLRRALRRARPLVDLRSRAMEDLWRVRGSGVGVGGLDVWA